LRYIHFFAVAILLCLSNVASAQETFDTVHLTNGGRVRGTVFSEEPDVGVTIKLIDGTTRTLPAATVKQVEYAGANASVAPAPAPASAPYAVYPGAGYPPAAPYVAQASGTHRRAGFLVPGIILLGVGALTLGISAGFMASEDCFDGCRDSKQTPGTAGMVTGGVLLAAGIPFFILGMIRVPDDRSADAPPLVPQRSFALLPSFTRDGFGLRLAGSL
jgi:hypothetical protein